MSEEIIVSPDDAIYSVANQLHELNNNIKDLKETFSIISNQLYDVFNEDGDGEVKVRLVKDEEK